MLAVEVGSGSCYHQYGLCYPDVRLVLGIDLAFGIGIVLFVVNLIFGVFPPHLRVEGGDGGGTGQAPHAQAAAVGGHCQVLSQQHLKTHNTYKQRTKKK